MTRPSSGWRAHAPFIAFLVAHVLVWTVIAALTRGSVMDRHGDMLENFVWGQEWQWGYHKHPPLFAWVSAAWLGVTAFSPWSYFLLSQINVAAGFVAIRAIAGEYMAASRAVTAVMLLELVPTFNIKSVKLNSHSILLSLWPLTALFAYRAVTGGRKSSWVLTGLFAGLSMLAWYYSALLLACLVMLLFATREGRRALRTPGPYLAALVFAAVVAPHIRWLVVNDYPTFGYALAHVDRSAAHVALRALEFVAAGVLYLTPLVAATWLLFRDRGMWRAPVPEDTSFRELFLPVMVGGPLALALALGLLLKIPLTSSWLIPLWFAASVLLLKPIAPRIADASNAAARRLVWGVLAAALVVSLSVGALSERARNVYSFPARELAHETERLWHDAYATPVRVVAGWWHAAAAVSFYSADHPSVLIDFDFGASPWVTPRRIDSDGVAVLCPEAIAECVERAGRMFPAAREGTFRIEAEERLFGRSRELAVRYFFVPPGASSAIETR